MGLHRIWHDWSDLTAVAVAAALFIITQKCKWPKYPSMGGWINKMLYSYNRKLFSPKKEWSTDICFNMDEAWKDYTEWVESVSKITYFMFLFIGNVQNRSIHRGRSKLAVARDRGMMTSKYRLMSMTTNKYDISFWGDENVLNLDTSIGCTTLWKH